MPPLPPLPLLPLLPLCHHHAHRRRERQASAIQVDLEKLAMLMKDFIDDMHTQGVDASRIEVVGLVVAGKFCTLSFEEH